MRLSPRRSAAATAALVISSRRASSFEQDCQNSACHVAGAKSLNCLLGFIVFGK